MSSKESVMAGVLELQDLLVSQKPKHGKFPGLDRLNRLMSSIKRVGCVEKMPFNGTEGTYLIIEGRSWQDVCRDLGVAAAPSFVMWEETEFLFFLRSQVVLAGENGKGSDESPVAKRRPARRPGGRRRAGTPKRTGRRDRKEAV